MPDTPPPSGDDQNPQRPATASSRRAPANQRLAETADHPHKKKWRYSWRSASPLTKLSLIFSAVVAMAAIASVIVARMQWNAMEGQICQMIDSGKQTDKLLSLYQQQLDQITKQANDTHDLAQAATADATASQNLANQAVIQSEQTANLVADTHILAVAAKEQLNLSQRPWMQVEIEPGAAHVDPSGFVVFDVPIKARNVGHSPAIKVNITAKVMSYGQIQPIKDTQQNLCKEAERGSSTGDGDIVFPDGVFNPVEPISSAVSLQTLKSEVASPSSNTFTTEKGDSVEIMGDTFREPDGRVSPAFLAGMKLRPDPKFFLIGCLDYTISYSKQRKQTMFLYDLENFQFQAGVTQDVHFTKHYGIGNDGT